VIAVDTNILVRIIVGDDEDQVERALALAARESLFVPSTVLLETEWVLRSRYGYDRATIVTALETLEKVANLAFEHDDDIHWALSRYAEGGEFADYLHIAASRRIGRFASFERKLKRRAGSDAPSVVEIPA
jgi:predicted nucleic-acid-binding protein